MSEGRGDLFRARPEIVTLGRSELQLPAQSTSTGSDGSLAHSLIEAS